MCGIAGFLAPGGLRDDSAKTLTSMTDAIERRGPDDSGQYFDKAAGVALGHRRLAILDLTPSGRQPMQDVSGRFVLTYNGEIYNFAELRTALEDAGEAPAWRGSSDTEILVAAVAAFGLREALRRAKGMFAIALWDRQEGVLHLARDRVGEKPLYFGWQGKGEERVFLFGSDVSALKQHPSFEGGTDAESIGLLLRYLYIPEPFSAWQGIRKVMPGTIITVNPRSKAEEVETYWGMVPTALEARTDPFMGGDEAAVDLLEKTLGDAIERQMVADVPLGAFLSGGVDSSTVAALMQARASRPVKTFTIGFEEPEFNEADHARAVAQHLGTDHTEQMVTASDAMAVIAQLQDIYREPFADSSQIPTFIVSRLARQSVTVALSGDGGDELFGGYNRHLYSHSHWGRIAKIPPSIRSWIPDALRGVSPRAWDKTVGRLVRHRVSAFGDKVHKVAGIIGSRTSDDLYDALTSINQDPGRLMGRELRRDPFTDRNIEGVSRLSTAERMMALDTVHYLPGDVLTKVDRAAMYNSLETRVPMLDPDVIALAWRLPVDLKIRGGTSKWVLRQLLYKHVPKTLVDRPKMGFALPLGGWLRGDLREWASALLEPRALEDSGLFDATVIRQLWETHLKGDRNLEHQLWPVLMTQAWLERDR
jgi:asparagine synthase (glutamine-hydrolysing)